MNGTVSNRAAHSRLGPAFAKGPYQIASGPFRRGSLINSDAQAIAKQLLTFEDEAARLFNLFAATQNALRQQVREQAFLNTSRRYQELFISDARLDCSTCSFDFGVGMSRAFCSPSSYTK